MPSRRLSRTFTQKRARSSSVGSGRTGLKRKRTRTYMGRSPGVQRALQGVRNLQRMIETKESTRGSTVNINMPHNNVYIIQDQSAAGDLNPFRLVQGLGDPMERGNGNRIGDKISLRGMLIRGMFENSLGRAKVFFRVMLIKCPKGEIPTRATLFKNDSANKMIDQVNTERYTIIMDKKFNISTTNNAPSAVGATGVPTTATASGVGTKLIKCWIPGKKFGRSGNLTYEDASSTQLKFFDYKLVVLCYDWLGTPQDINNVGVLNELYTKLYFKDA